MLPASIEGELGLAAGEVEAAEKADAFEALKGAEDRGAITGAFQVRVGFQVQEGLGELSGEESPQDLLQAAGDAKSGFTAAVEQLFLSVHGRRMQRSRGFAMPMGTNGESGLTFPAESRREITQLGCTDL